jgi:hypothetical protein
MLMPTNRITQTHNPGGGILPMIIVGVMALLIMPRALHSVQAIDIPSHMYQA